MDTKAPTVALSCHIPSSPLLATGQKIHCSKPYNQFIRAPRFLYNRITAASKIDTILMVTLIFTKNCVGHLHQGINKTVDLMVIQGIFLVLETLAIANWSRDVRIC